MTQNKRNKKTYKTALYGKTKQTRHRYGVWLIGMHT